MGPRREERGPKKPRPQNGFLQADWRVELEKVRQEMAEAKAAGKRLKAAGEGVRATAPVIQCGTRVLVPLLDSLMFGRVLK